VIGKSGEPWHSLLGKNGIDPVSQACTGPAKVLRRNSRPHSQASFFAIDLITFSVDVELFCKGATSVAPLQRNHQASGELEQIQFLRGYVSVQMTERYLGCRQRLHDYGNDRLGLESGAPSAALLPTDRLPVTDILVE
jgi:hypothetical protein